jgi:hypothetical protein
VKPVGYPLDPVTEIRRAEVTKLAGELGVPTPSSWRDARGTYTVNHILWVGDTGPPAKLYALLEPSSGKPAFIVNAKRLGEGKTRYQRVTLENAFGKEATK